MTRDELLDKLRKMKTGEGYEYENYPEFIDRGVMHEDADALLLEYINDTEITDAFHSIRKWYS